MAVRKAKIVSRPEAGWIPKSRGGKLVIVGDGDINIVCGNCVTPLVSNMAANKLQGCTADCPDCGCTNDIATS